MYYISSNPKGNTFGVTDTSDGVEEFYTSKELWDICHGAKGLNVKGVECWNYDTECTVLILDRLFNVALATKLGHQMRERHNSITIHKLCDYFATLKPGIKVEIKGSYIGDGTKRRHYITHVYKKLDYEHWELAPCEDVFNDGVLDLRNFECQLELDLCHRDAVIREV